MSVDDQLKTIYIGKLPEDVPDSVIQSALKHIPGLELWVKFTRANGKPTNYGLARYSTAGAVKVALDVIPNVKLKDINLIAKAEENTYRWLESQGAITAESVARRSQSDLEKLVQGTFTMWLQNNPSSSSGSSNTRKLENKNRDESGGVVVPASTGDSDVMDLYKKSQQRKGLYSVPGEERDEVFDEIIRFRELSLNLEKVRLAQDFNYESKEGQNGRATAGANHHYGSYDDDDSENENYIYNFPNEDDADIDDETLEKQREERENDHKQRRFEDRERRWLARERTRANALERERERDETYETRLQRSKERAMADYAKFGDLVEARKDHLYYTDHPTWVKERMIFRNREIERDEADRRDELKNAGDIDDVGTKVPKASLSSGISLSFEPKPSINEPASSSNITSTSKPTISIDLQKDQKPSFVSKDIPPVDKPSELFEWTVQWGKVDENVVESVLRPVAIEAIIEYLGVQEDELVDFVLQHIRDHKPAKDLVSELSEPLDEDAEPLVATVWRQLLVKTEQ